MADANAKEPRGTGVFMPAWLAENFIKAKSARKHKKGEKARCRKNSQQSEQTSSVGHASRDAAVRSEAQAETGGSRAPTKQQRENAASTSSSQASESGIAARAAAAPEAAVAPRTGAAGKAAVPAPPRSSATPGEHVAPAAVAVQLETDDHVPDLQPRLTAQQLHAIQLKYNRDAQLQQQLRGVERSPASFSSSRQLSGPPRASRGSLDGASSTSSSTVGAGGGGSSSAAVARNIPSPPLPSAPGSQCSSSFSSVGRSDLGRTTASNRSSTDAQEPSNSCNRQQGWQAAAGLPRTCSGSFTGSLQLVTPALEAYGAGSYSQTTRGQPAEQEPPCQQQAQQQHQQQQPEQTARVASGTGTSSSAATRQQLLHYQVQQQQQQQLQRPSSDSTSGAATPTALEQSWQQQTQRALFNGSSAGVTSGSGGYLYRSSSSCGAGCSLRASMDLQSSSAVSLPSLMEEDVPGHLPGHGSTTGSTGSKPARHYDSAPLPVLAVEPCRIAAAAVGDPSTSSLYGVATSVALQHQPYGGSLGSTMGGRHTSSSSNASPLRTIHMPARMEGEVSGHVPGHGSTTGSMCSANMRHYDSAPLPVLALEPCHIAAAAVGDPNSSHVYGVATSVALQHQQYGINTGSMIGGRHGISNSASPLRAIPMPARQQQQSGDDLLILTGLSPIGASPLGGSSLNVTVLDAAGSSSSSWQSAAVVAHTAGQPQQGELLHQQQLQRTRSASAVVAAAAVDQSQQFCAPQMQGLVARMVGGRAAAAPNSTRLPGNSLAAFHDQLQAVPAIQRQESFAEHELYCIGNDESFTVSREVSATAGQQGFGVPGVQGFSLSRAASMTQQGLGVQSFQGSVHETMHHSIHQMLSQMDLAGQGVPGANTGTGLVGAAGLSCGLGPSNNPTPAGIPLSTSLGRISSSRIPSFAAAQSQQEQPQLGNIRGDTSSLTLAGPVGGGSASPRFDGLIPGHTAGSGALARGMSGQDLQCGMQYGRGQCNSEPLTSLNASAVCAAQDQMAATTTSSISADVLMPLQFSYQQHSHMLRCHQQEQLQLQQHEEQQQQQQQVLSRADSDVLKLEHLLQMHHQLTAATSTAGNAAAAVLAAESPGLDSSAGSLKAIPTAAAAVTWQHGASSSSPSNLGATLPGSVSAVAAQQQQAVGDAQQQLQTKLQQLVQVQQMQLEIQSELLQLLPLV